MIVYALVLGYLGVGIWFAIWLRSSFEKEDQWLAVVPVVMLFWIAILSALFFVKVYYDVRNWWRWQRRAR